MHGTYFTDPWLQFNHRHCLARDAIDASPVEELALNEPEGCNIVTLHVGGPGPNSLPLASSRTVGD